MFKMIATLGLAMALWVPQHAKAAGDCTFPMSTDGQMYRIRFPAFDSGQFDPDAIDEGDTFASTQQPQAAVENSTNPTATRFFFPGKAGDVSRGTTAPAPIMLKGRPVYPSSIPGVGLAIKHPICAPLGWWPATLMSGGTQLSPGCMITVELVKTGPISSGSMSGEFAGYFSIPGGSQFLSLVWSGEVHVTPSVPTCAPTVADKVVNMGRIEASSITDDGYSNAVPFTMDVGCSGGVPANKTQQMSVTFTDATNTTNTTDRLTLTSASTATGVKVQLLKGGTPVTFGTAPTNGLDKPNSIALGTIQNGSYSFPMAARYVQTGPVTPGVANAMATFVFTYH
ncbi:fimbrial protein [Lysobacter sp. FW306-1B-D06B]|uniref:fimbrial protein n=1 Tax=Lysobacter sp. FW306-1B-D06B TaxID=3140250 RepID=UPI0031408D7F